MNKNIKAYKGIPMEGIIASWYAKTTLKDLKSACIDGKATR